MQYHHNILNHKDCEVICHLLHSDSYINHTTRVRRYVLLYMTVLTKPALFAPKLNSILLPQFTDTLNIYPSPVYQVLNVNWSAFFKSILPTLQSWLEQWDPWRAPIGQWGPVFALTGCVAHWCVIGHCVGIVAAHVVSLGVVFATSHPTPPHPIPSRHPSHPLYYQY